MSKKKICEKKVRLIVGQAKAGIILSFLGKKANSFCKEFNNDEKLKEKKDKLISVNIILYNDGTYEYTSGTTPTVYLLKNRCSNFDSLSKKEKKIELEKERKKITHAELERIAKEVMPNLNTDDLEKAKKIILGTARNIGIEIV